MVKIMENPIKTLLKWMIWGYHYFWKHPFGGLQKEGFFVEDLLFFVEALPALASVMSGQVVVPPGCREMSHMTYEVFHIFTPSACCCMERASPVFSEDFLLTSKLYSFG